jgi:hypothetical protein
MAGQQARVDRIERSLKRLGFQLRGLCFLQPAFEFFSCRPLLSGFIIAHPAFLLNACSPVHTMLQSRCITGEFLD